MCEFLRAPATGVFSIRRTAALTVGKTSSVYRLSLSRGDKLACQGWREDG